MSAEQIPYEEAFARFEAIVRRLESDEVKLEESLKLFEEGVKLARLCSAKLDAAEGRIRMLLEEGGRVEEHPLEELPGAASS